MRVDDPTYRWFVRTATKREKTRRRYVVTGDVQDISDMDKEVVALLLELTSRSCAPVLASRER